MTRQLVRCALLVICGIVLSTASVALDYSLEFQGGGGFRGNLYSDSTNTLGSYSALNLRVTTYPFSSLELRVTASQSYYPEIIGLSNVIGCLELTYIPTSQNSPFSLLFSGRSMSAAIMVSRGGRGKT